ncbi:AAA family ATPase [Salibacteraceae bacterium]|nr:AAA family ATPase [Salibacteraceae bacterium]
MLEENQFINEISAQTDIPLNKDQLDALSGIYQFLFTGGACSAFILKGYAGTGKTTLMGCLIRWLHSVNRKTVLLAPTGRSAKVLSAHSGYGASTIHRRIYAVKSDDFGKFSMHLIANKSERTIFIVDEASMIGDASQQEGANGRSLISDLVEYVYSGERCRLILIGDEAQLPPVGMELSPALDKKAMAGIVGGPVFQNTLRSVVRQEDGSLVLENATKIRNQISEGVTGDLKIVVDPKRSVEVIDSYDLEDRLASAFSSERAVDSIIICKSNKEAFQFNSQIRAQILDRETEIESGDRLMIVKNNYFWKIPGRRQNFLANGDMIFVERMHTVETFGPFRFADCEVSLVDEEVPPFHMILLLNAIDFQGPAIPARELFKLREEMIKSGIVDAADPQERFFQNPYFNAAQVKYAYAVTCHKSQGGQWANVFVLQGYLTEEMINKSYYRWLYTAITRATEKLGLIGFHADFIE